MSNKRQLKFSLHIITMTRTCTRLCVYALTLVCVCLCVRACVCLCVVRVCVRACDPDSFISSYLHHLTGLCHCSLASRLSGPVISHRHSRARFTRSATFPLICHSLALPAPPESPPSRPSVLRTLPSLSRPQQGLILEAPGASVEKGV